jgi:hypothetical protein
MAAIGAVPARLFHETFCAVVKPSANHPSLSLAGYTLAQLRQMARTTSLRNVYSRLSRSQLINALQQVLPEQRPSMGHPSPQPPAVNQPEHGSQVTFLPRDPQWAYVFWDVSRSDQQRAAAAGASQLCLRVNDVTGLQPGQSHPHALQEVVVDANTREWYLPLPLCDRDYRVELGYRLTSGGWLHLAFSSVARMPADGPSNVVADLFVPFSLDVLPAVLATMTPAQTGGGVEHERMYRQAIAASPRRLRLGSEAWHEQADAEEWGDRQRASASGAGLWASGRSESGRGLVQPRSFWLVADAELVVYGATEPSASLFIGDEQVPLNRDGTFRLQVPFRDGQQVYPIRAVAADGEQERSIRLEFARSTPEARVNSQQEAVLEWF